MAKKKAFTTWTVAGKEYDLKLKSSSICEAEEKLGGTNILMYIGAENGFPTLNAMMIITYYAMKPWNHGIELNEVYDLYDTYIEEGHNMTEFYTDVFVNIYEVSGFFGKAQVKSLEKAAKEIKA